MPNYTLNHVHHETDDVPGAIEFYKRVFNATASEPEDRKGVLWAFVKIGDIQITLTNRESTPVQDTRNKAFDHIALTTDDFAGSLAHVQQVGAHIWAGPLVMDGRQIIFVSGPDNIRIELIEQI